MDAILLTLGLVILVGAGDALVRGAVALSLQFGIPAFIISVTVVAIGTSVPELLISVQAALADAPGIALGNVVGSNIANVLLVLGIPALIVPIAGCGPAAHRNLYLMLGATVLFSGFILGGTLFRWAGLVLVSVAMIATASSAAFAAPASPMASVATGTPAGIWTIESRLSRPLSARLCTGTPSTGSRVFAASIPGRCAAPPAPAIITRKPRPTAVSA